MKQNRKCKYLIIVILGELADVTAEKVTGNVTQVACGKGLFAPSCAQCPYDENGNYHGGFRCSHDCRWDDNECKKGCNFCTGNLVNSDDIMTTIYFTSIMLILQTVATLLR